MTRYYVERGDSAQHLPIAESTGRILLSHGYASTLHQEAGMVVLRLSKAFQERLAA